MSLIPMLFDYDPFEYYYRCRFPYRSLFDWDHFGLNVTPEEIRALVSRPRSRIISPSRCAPEHSGELVSIGVIGKDGFQASIDVQQFKPNEITVKTVDNSVIVEGKHEERQDEHGYISRRFIRKYVLPEGYDPKDVVSTLSSDGVLTIKAPSPPPPAAAKDAESNERIVQIQQTGPAHLNVKENSTEEEQQKKEDKQNEPKE